MHNPHSLYLISKSVQEDRLREAEQQRLINQARANQPESRKADLALSVVARSVIVIALAIVLNIAV